MTPQAPTDSKSSASALSVEAGAPDIEVTSAMMAAGAQALSEFYLSLNGELDLFPQIVRTVFCRMEAARR